jgi:hypothetical protein
MNPETWIKYNAITLLADEIFLQRNAVYRDSFRETGFYGAAVEIIGQTARLKGAVQSSPLVQASLRGTIRDILLDLINFAHIAIMMLDEENWLGIDLPEEENDR